MRDSPRETRIRPITAEDIPATVPLLAQLGYEMTLEEAGRRVREVLAMPNHALLVAEIAGRIAGLLHVFVRPAVENPREAVVEALVVAENCRRVGVGRRLMEGALAFCRQNYAAQPVALTAQTYLRRFYESLGFAAVSDPFDDFGLAHIHMRLPRP